MTTTWFASDLHLDLGPSDARNPGGAFASFLDAVVRPGAAAGGRLVLLGDVFELAGYRCAPGQRERWAAARLGELADRHQPMFDALRSCLRAGLALDVLPGNHDVDLSRPRARARLAELLDGCAGPGRVRVHSWMLHEPGLFLAAHGNQEHDLNRFPTLLLASLPGPAGELAAPPLAAPRASGPATRARRMAALTAAVAKMAGAEAAAGTAGYNRLLDREAAASELPGDVVRELAAVTRFRLPSTVARLARAVPGRRLGLVEPDDYLQRAAVRADAVLRRHGRDVPFLIYGHTHRHGVVRLPGTDARYLNCGTWSSHVQGLDRAHANWARFPYVVVERHGDRSEVALRYWTAATPAGPRPGESR